MDCRKPNGFTLVEFLVSVVLIVILIAVAVPEFLDFIRASRLSTQTNRFFTAVNFARSEAIKRSAPMMICVRSGALCATVNNWEQGWIVFVDRDADLQVDPGETVKEFPPLAQGYSLKPNVAVSSLKFFPDGTVRRASGALPLMTLRFCAPDATDGNLTQRSREIVINATGRMRLQPGREIAGAC